MNLFVLKYCVLIGALLSTTAFVAVSQNPGSHQSGDEGSTPIDTRSIFVFGSQVFYHEVSQPGNEYMQSSVEGYSQNLVPTDEEDNAYEGKWKTGVKKFLTGYNLCDVALVNLASVPQMQTNKEKAEVCGEFLAGENALLDSKNDFLAAKASTSPATYSGFTIAMVLERVDEISQNADTADQACMNAVLADHNHDSAEFSKNLMDARNAVKEMERIYPELQVLSSDFT